MGLPRNLDAKRVDRATGGQEEGPQVWSSKGEIRRNLRSLDDSQMDSFGSKDPSSPWPRTEDVPFHINFQAVRHAVGLVR